MMSIQMLLKTYSYFFIVSYWAVQRSPLTADPQKLLPDQVNYGSVGQKSNRMETYCSNKVIWRLVARSASEEAGEMSTGP